MTDVERPREYSIGYFVRIQRIEEYDDKIRTLGDYADYTRILCLAHKGDADDPNAHYHLVIETNVREKAFWKRIVKLFNAGKGNGNASHKPWDGSINACSYMFHEEDDDATVFYNKGFTEDDIRRMKENNANVKERMRDAKQGSHTEKQLAKHKKTIWDVVNEVRTAMPTREDAFTGNVYFIGKMMKSGEMEYPEETAYNILIATLEKYKIRATDYELKRWLDTILRIDPCFNVVKKNILSKYRDG